MAGWCGNNEAEWYRQAQTGHLAEIRAFAPEQFVVVLAALVEQVHPLRHVELLLLFKRCLIVAQLNLCPLVGLY
jgi:hypothetical protein